MQVAPSLLQQGHAFTLDGGEVLPGLRLPMAQLYAAVTKPE